MDSRTLTSGLQYATRNRVAEHAPAGRVIEAMRGTRKALSIPSAFGVPSSCDLGLQSIEPGTCRTEEQANTFQD
jgi:hypothetical protein